MTYIDQRHLDLLQYSYGQQSYVHTPLYGISELLRKYRVPEPLELCRFERC